MDRAGCARQVEVRLHNGHDRALQGKTEHAVRDGLDGHLGRALQVTLARDCGDGRQRCLPSEYVSSRDAEKNKLLQRLKRDCRKFWGLRVTRAFSGQTVILPPSFM